MAGDTPFRKRRFRTSGIRRRRRWRSRAPEDGVLTSTRRLRHGAGTPGPPAPPRRCRRPQRPDEGSRQRSGARRLQCRQERRPQGRRERQGAAQYVADRIIENAPRVPVRDLATLRAQFPGLGPEQLADKLIAGAANATSTVGAGIGAAAMLPVPPAMPAELAAEITGVAAIELKLIAELHEVYGHAAARQPQGAQHRLSDRLDGGARGRPDQADHARTSRSAARSSASCASRS